MTYSESLRNRVSKFDIKSNTTNKLIPHPPQMRTTGQAAAECFLDLFKSWIHISCRGNRITLRSHPKLLEPNALVEKCRSNKEELIRIWNWYTRREFKHVYVINEKHRQYWWIEADINLAGDQEDQNRAFKENEKEWRALLDHLNRAVSEYGLPKGWSYHYRIGYLPEKEVLQNVLK
jgi:hypothetical protein